MSDNQHPIVERFQRSRAIQRHRTLWCLTAVVISLGICALAWLALGATT
jgi:hypothetical protein